MERSYIILAGDPGTVHSNQEYTAVTADNGKTLFIRAVFSPLSCLDSLDVAEEIMRPGETVLNTIPAEFGLNKELTSNMDR